MENRKIVKEIFEDGKAVNLMTPAGFVYLTAQQVKDVLDCKAKEITINAGFRGCDMRIPPERLLECVAIRGGYNAENDTNEYLVDYPEQSKSDV